MRPFQIFRPGRHTASNGKTIEFSEADLRAAVAAYDPAVHEAPIVVGHPKDNAPAYGWVKSLSFDEDGAVVAEPIQVDAAFAEMVTAGRFKKRSASFYTPDAPNNPKPGTYYLRHVGFLGAQPPAVKGLKDVNFADDEQGVVEFADAGWVANLVATFARRMREFFISEFGLEKADTVVPDYLVSDLEAEGRKPVEAVPSTPSFSEGNPPMSKEIEALQAQLQAANEAKKAAEQKLEQQAAEFAERERRIAEREAAMARADVEARVERMVKDGKVLPAAKKATVDFAMTLSDAEATYDFGEGDKAKKVTQRGLYLEQLAAGPKLVDYDEQSADNGARPAANAGDPQKVADRARELIAKAAEAGKALSYTEAVAQASAEFTAE